MSTHNVNPNGDEHAVVPHGEHAVVPADPIADPGLHHEDTRLTDVDDKAERRAERQVAGMFTLAALLTVAFIVFYVVVGIHPDDPENGVNIGDVQVSNLTLGLTLGLALFLVGAGAVQWARSLMTSPEVVHERHELRSDDETRAAALNDFEVGTEETGFGRRKLIRNSLLGALALLPLPAVIMLRDLGPNTGGTPAQRKEHTIWAEGVRVLTDVTFMPIRAADLEIGQLVNAMPATFEDLPEHGPERINERAKSPVMLVRMLPEDIHIAPGRENWGVDGILAYSKICTHVGCPISLYEQTTHHMLCPCHQSTFDLSDNGKVIFGPATRSLPQLPIAVDSEGYLIAQSDFTEPVGPSYWERTR
ncbi:ubiquinol-cytochrome c reductase iron-sulfur subunit [Jiangella sp. DSM 45060]|uniref:cytochrome bc1 complex Rieske iron-sulfur subunit n=1 Tax=Jiangella sp. DSM 45060 TaxID=1798224 RepID=UPI00087B2435|nr:Rieske 2Fe-2S domain-containing protein [Jiangella sp. DSM 45060]SDT29643.1 menaquinol-cytochrome c reductase iron-sulfur subunit precursor [Jiangella sp. DSM 45060]